jgi:hypothetical protein
MDRKALISVVVVLVVLALVAVGVMIWQSSTTIAPKAAHSDNLATVGPKDFSDGIGFYYSNDGKYNFLIWKKNLFTPPNAPSERDIAVAAAQAIGVKKGVRFYSYGIDFSKLGVVPPYALGFCIVEDVKTIEGIFPIRIKPVDSPGYIYELVPPPLIDDLSSGKVKHLFWVINDQYSCKEGWVFKFQ